MNTRNLLSNVTKIITSLYNTDAILSLGCFCRNEKSSWKLSSDNQNQSYAEIKKLNLHGQMFSFCRFSWMVYQLSIMANHFWLLNEGIYLLKVVHLNSLPPIPVSWTCRSLAIPYLVRVIQSHLFF